MTNNIAEGHGSGTYRHNMSYLRRSRGSMYELIDDIAACRDERFFKTEHLDDLASNAMEVIRLINGYLRYLRRRQAEALKRKPE